MKKSLLAALLLSPALFFGQLPVTLEDCFETFRFYPETSPSLRFLKNGRTYIERSGPLLVEKSIETGDSIRPFFDKREMAGEASKLPFTKFELSADEGKMLLAADVRPIYRHSFEANYWVHERISGRTEQLDPEGPQQAAAFSPNGLKVAWVRANNVFFKDLTTGQTTQVTSDGKENEVINGVADWVYEEEFSPVTGAGMSAMEWSPDSKWLAWLRFDESKVPQARLDYFEEGMYPRGYKYKFPKAGAANSVVTVHTYNTTDGSPVDTIGKRATADLGTDEQYVPRIKWAVADQLTATRLNRHQDHLQVFLVDPKDGATNLLLDEKSKTYVDVNDDLTFIPSAGALIWPSETDGWRHLYLHGADGMVIRQLTSGSFDVTAFYGLEPTTGTIFYQTATPTPMDRQVWSFQMSTPDAKPYCLTPFPGTSEASFSPSFEFLKLDWSDQNTPPRSWVCNVKGKILRQLVDNQQLVAARERHGFAKRNFFSFKTPDGTELNGWLLKPRDFDANRKYPVLMSVYGGPGSQEVLNSYDGFFGTYYQMLAQQGVVVACVDNRGTGGRGKAFKDCTHMDLGKLEVADQIEAAKYLGRQPWADPARIGIWGWSYGGYMSANCLFKGNDVFKSAAAVAPVVNWKWYDSAYTERFLHTPEENPKGYDDNSPINFADRMKGNFFLAHGLADDNVHWQNSAELSNALIKNNKQFEEHFYPNRDHSIAGDGATMHLFWELTEFFMTKL